MTNNNTLAISLNRLLKHQDVTELLDVFTLLLPPGDLALLRVDGRLFAGTGTWEPAALPSLLNHPAHQAIFRGNGLYLQPLVVRSCLAGVVAWRLQTPYDGDNMAIRHTLRSLHLSLSLLLEQSMETRDILNETLDRYRELNLLYRIGEAIGGRLDLQTIPQLVLEEAHNVIPAVAGAVLLAPMAAASSATAQALASVAQFGAGGCGQQLAEVSRPIVDQVYENGRATIAVPPIPVLAGQESEADGQITMILCVPLKVQERVLGVLLLGRLAGQPEFTASDEKLVMALAGQAAIALETARLHQEEIKRQRLEEELAIGRQIQFSLLPEACPDIPGWDFAAVYRPARMVGGDLYDFVQPAGAPGRIGLIIADVTGKGVPAALFMAFSRTVLRIESASGRSPGSVLQQTNRHIVNDLRSPLFLSAFYASLDTANGRLTYANGGHEWPLWLQAATGEVQWLAARGLLLGTFKNIAPEEHEVTVEPGDTLIFYTDGVTEARNSEGAFFDEERLREVVRANAGLVAPAMVQAIVTGIETFTGGMPQADDLTLFVVRRRPNR